MKSIKSIREELDITVERWDSFSILKQSRLLIEYSAKEMADMIGVARSAIYNYECGIRQPEIEIAHRIIDKLKKKGIDVTLEQLKPRRDKK